MNLNPFLRLLPH